MTSDNQDHPASSLSKCLLQQEYPKQYRWLKALEIKQSTIARALCLLPKHRYQNTVSHGYSNRGKTLIMTFNLTKMIKVFNEEINKSIKEIQKKYN